MAGNSSPYAARHVGLFPDTSFVPTYLYHDIPHPELAIELDDGWRMHVHLHASGAAYLRKLATTLLTAADVAEEIAALPAVPAITARAGAR